MTSVAERAVARLLLPAVRWDRDQGFHSAWPEIERALEAGVGGFIVFGGEAAAAGDLIDEMRRRAPHPLLIASDLERGAGQQFRGATPLPPAAAIGSLDDLEVTRRAAEVTAREARALGIGCVLAPVADVDLEPRNPIVGTRAFAADPLRASRQVEAWVRGCTDGGALSCVKHFPGTGRAIRDSHSEQPRITADREALEQDLLPFRAAIAAGTDAVMAAHVVYPALDASGQPATRSAVMLGPLLHRSLRFDGLVMTDAINMAGFAGDGGEGTAAVEAVAAGCDVLLYPAERDRTIGALADALRTGRIEESRVRASNERIARAAARAGERIGGPPGRPEDLEWAGEVAARSIRVIRGEPWLHAARVSLVTIDDDLGGPHPPPSRDALPVALRSAGVEMGHGGQRVLAIYADVRAWKGRSGLSGTAVEQARSALAEAPDAIVLLFGHPRQAHQLPFAGHILLGWGGEPLMQQAAARRLTDHFRSV